MVKEVSHPGNFSELPGLASTFPSVLTMSSIFWSFPGGSHSKASAYNVGDQGSIPGSGRSPGEGNGNTLKHSCLENAIDRGAWWATVHEVAESWTQLNNYYTQNL